MPPSTCSDVPRDERPSCDHSCLRVDVSHTYTLGRRNTVTTLPAKAGSFWLVPEASALTGASRATLVATHFVNARRPDPGPRSEPGRLEGAASLPVFLLSRGEVLN